MKSVFYYVTGHGFGHAGRAAMIARQLLELRPDLRVIVRTGAPAFIFEDLGPRGSHVPAAIDFGAIEDSPVSLNWPKTLDALEDLLGRRDRIIAAEAAEARAHNVRLIVADIPFLAGDIAAALNVPAVGIGNFTWDWVYEPYLWDDARRRWMLPIMREGYRKIGTLLQLPFAHPKETFARIIDVPFTARPPGRPADEILRMLGLDAADSRRRVLIAMRGAVDAALVRAVAMDCPDVLFLYAGELPQPLANVKTFAWSADLQFHDVLSVSDAAVSKLGHGIATDCVASRTPLLWPPRNDFREDAVLAAGLSAYVPHREISLDNFFAGQWSAHLRALWAMPRPAVTADLNGVDVCAQYLCQQIP